MHSVCSHIFSFLCYLNVVSLRCLAHVINLATQALIKGYSKSKHYDPAKPNEHFPDTDALIQDEVGLVHAIAVKVSTYMYEIYSACYHIYRSALLPNERSFLGWHKLRRWLRRLKSWLAKPSRSLSVPNN